MRKTSIHLKLTITFILCFCIHINIKAAFIEHPNTVIDTVNNLEWYKHDLTSLGSFAQMVSNFSNPASPFFGFRHATSSEIIDLWEEAGIARNNDPLVVDGFLDIFGRNFGNGQYSLYNQVEDEFIFDMEGIPVGVIPGHREIIHLVGSGGNFQHDPGDAHLFTSAALDDVFGGQAIVRAAIPEPSTYLMFATLIGFAGIFSYRKNKYLKGVN